MLDRYPVILCIAENIISYKILFNIYYIIDNVDFDCLRIVTQIHTSTQILQILYIYKPKYPIIRLKRVNPIIPVTIPRDKGFYN